MAREARSFPDFAVACGEEASDPLVLHRGRVVRVDELQASGHLRHQDDDLAAVAGLGVRWWRYGMPWRLVEPSSGEYDWTLWDGALDACSRHGLEPVVDLVHFGLPDHLPGFCDGAWVDAFLRYVDAFLRRYPEPAFFTPVNEPMITAMCSGFLGIWNDRRTSRADYLTALANVTLANLEALARIDADRSGWWIGAEGFGCHVAVTPDDEPSAAAARALEQLVWDLHLGVEPRAEVADVADVVADRVLARIGALAGRHPRVVAGHDVYPVSITVHGRRDGPLTIDERIGAYEAEARAWFARYGQPFWVAETSNLGLTVEEGPIWLDRLVDAVDRLRADGLPARGVCWYSRGDQYDWHTMLTAPVGEVTAVGLFDAERRSRRVASAFSHLAVERGDLHYPLVHLRPPSGWVNDPNGAVQHRGRAHLFFQHSRDPDWLIREWGHAVTDDLAHWEVVRVAVSPTPGWPDEWGVWSGSVVVDDDDVAHAFYSGLSASPGPQAPMHAVSVDADLAAWRKDGGGVPVVPPFPADTGVHTMRDPSVRRTSQGWEMLVGAGLDGGVPAILRYRSEDLVAWTFAGTFARGDTGALMGEWTGTVWECPQLFEVDGSAVLTVSVFDPDAHPESAYLGVIHHSRWMTGQVGDDGFTPWRHGVLDRGCFYAPQTLVLDGRAVMFGWIWEGRRERDCRDAGWAGMVSLPREVHVDGTGRVGLEPVPELRRLRGAHHRVGPMEVAGDVLLGDLGERGDCVEIVVELDSLGGCDEVGVVVFADVEADELTRVGYVPSTGALVIDRGAGQHGVGDMRSVRLESDPVGTANTVTLHVFVDRSVVEVFADGVALTGRTYPSGPECHHIGVYTRGGAARVRRLDLWELNRNAVRVHVPAAATVR